MQETRIPREGHFLISDDPSWNQRHLNEVIFEGEVDDHLEIEIAGEELDLVRNDQLPTYRRVFEGPRRAGSARIDRATKGRATRSG